MANLPWWTGYPQNVWTELDWAQWEKEGRPRLPLEVKLPARDRTERPLVQPEPQHTLPRGVRWVGDQARTRPRDARAKSIDAMLAKLGIHPQ
jgi:hypothetical protein